MTCEIVLGISPVKALHQVVPGHFRQDGGSRNRGTEPVSLHDCKLGQVQPRKLQGINQKKIRQKKIRRAPKGLHGLIHRPARGLEDVDPVNLLVVNHTDPVSDGLSQNLPVKHLPP